MPQSFDRAELFADTSLVGAVFCRAYSRRADEWLAHLFAEAQGPEFGVALVAVGGYGRAELSPNSDLDVVLLHEKGVDVEELAANIWYPVWDEGIKLGHSVRTPRQALALAKEDLDTATALLSMRHLAGDASLSKKLAGSAAEKWVQQARHWLPMIEERTAQRHETTGEVAFMLEPDLKDGRGGLRDVHAIDWAMATDDLDASIDYAAVLDSYETLLAIRVELHRSTGRSSNLLLLEEQDAVADRLGYADADVLMSAVAAAGRTISWASDDIWRRLLHRPHRWAKAGKRHPLGNHMSSVDGGLLLEPDANTRDPLLGLQVAQAAAEHGLTIERSVLEVLATEVPPLPEPWPVEARKLFEQTLLAGHAAIPVMEALDHVELLHRMIPEWEANRSRPQRNAYHRFTVDRHLLETAAVAAGLVDRVDRPDLLVVGALLHDIGKGYPGDHTVVGVEMIAPIARRMGYNDADTQLLVAMCRHHLLLPDVATRRDIGDDSTIAFVADEVDDLVLLQLLDGLTEADSIATGPAAWSRWKAGLVRELVERTAVHIASDEPVVTESTFPTDAQLAVMQRGVLSIAVHGDHVTVVLPDAQALLWRVAGTIALHGLDVLQADLYSQDHMALQVFRVEVGGWGVDAERLSDDIVKALAGEIKVFSRLTERQNAYANASRRVSPVPVVPTQVRVDNATSDRATIIEVSATDSIGLLCRLARTISELDLDITTAKVQTLGEQAVDSFYVVDVDGNKISDETRIAAIETAITDHLASLVVAS